MPEAALHFSFEMLQALKVAREAGSWAQAASRDLEQLWDCCCNFWGNFSAIAGNCWQILHTTKHTFAKDAKGPETCRLLLELVGICWMDSALQFDRIGFASELESPKAGKATEAIVEVDCSRSAAASYTLL